VQDNEDSLTLESDLPLSLIYYHYKI